MIIYLYPLFSHTNFICIYIYIYISNAQEFTSSSFGLADLFAIYYLITRVSTRGYPKQILIGLSWAAADVLLTKFVVYSILPSN